MLIRILVICLRFQFPPNRLQQLLDSLPAHAADREYLFAGQFAANFLQRIIIDRHDPPISIVPRTGNHEKGTGDGAAGDLTIESCGQLPLHHPGGPSRSRCAAEG